MDEWDLRINGPKTTINVPSCIYLGHEVDGDGKRHTQNRMTGIQNMRRPYDRHQVKAFMGGVNYLREHLGLDFAELTVPINNLLKKNASFTWTDECQQCFEKIKERAAQNVKLYWLDYGKKIYIRCDASKMGCGAQLFQIGEDSFERTVSFISKTFTKTEQNWSTLEQELFAAVWSVKTWKSWLEGAHFHIQTDHKNILQLQKSVAPKVVRWRLAMQQFDYTITHVEGAGAKHAIADCISRLHGPQKQSTLSAAAMTTRAQSSAAKSLLEEEASKTGLNQSKTQVLETKTPVLESKTRVLRSNRVFGDLKPGLAKSKHAKTKFKTPKTPILDPKTPVLEQGDSKNTSWKGLDGQGISEAIDSAGRQATDFTQVHRGADLKGRTDSSKPGGRRKGIQSEDARNAEAEHISVHLDSPPSEKQIAKRKHPKGMTPEIVKTIQEYHNAVVGHMGRTRTWERLQQAVKDGKLEEKDCPTKENLRRRTAQPKNKLDGL